MNVEPRNEQLMLRQFFALASALGLFLLPGGRPRFFFGSAAGASSTGFASAGAASGSGTGAGSLATSTDVSGCSGSDIFFCPFLVTCL